MAEVNTQRIVVFSKQCGCSGYVVYRLFIIPQAELVALRQEKEAALQRCEKLEDEIQALRVYYR